MGSLKNFAAAVFVVAVAGTANAESGFPADFDASVSGLRIGQSIDEAREVIDGLFPTNIEDVPKTDQLVAPNEPIRAGAVRTEETAKHPLIEQPISISIGASDAVEANDRFLRTVYSYSGNAASVLLSSPANGQRVEAIHRAISYRNDPLNHDAFLEALVNRYGEVHFSSLKGRLMWAFKDGQEIPPARFGPDFAPYQKCTAIGNSPRYAVVADNLTLSPPRNVGTYFNGRSIAYPAHAECDAGLLVEYQQDQNDLVISVSFTFVDFKLMVEDQEDFLVHLAELEAKAEAERRASAPTGKTSITDF